MIIPCRVRAKHLEGKSDVTFPGGFWPEQICGSKMSTAIYSTQAIQKEGRLCHSTTYKSVSQVVQEFQIVYTEADFVVESPIQVSESFRSELSLVLQEGAIDTSEYAICEKFIYPILKEVWKTYREHLLLWSHPDAGL